MKAWIQDQYDVTFLICETSVAITIDECEWNPRYIYLKLVAYMSNEENNILFLNFTVAVTKLSGKTYS